MVPILILAAGRSSRMGGRDKLLEPVDNVPLLRRQALRAIATGHPVFVALPDPDISARSKAVGGLAVTCLRVPEASEGMSGTLRGAVARMPHNAGVLLVLADLVDLTTADLQTVLSAPARAPDALVWRGATQDGKAGHPVLFAPALMPDFAGLSGDTGAAPLLARLAGRICPVPLPADHARRDLDTPADWAAWRANGPDSDATLGVYRNKPDPDHD